MADQTTGTRSIEQEYRDRHRGSFERYERAVQAIPSGVTHDARFLRPFPLYMTRSLGSKKWDVDGNELIDYAMGHGALILGHSNPEIVDAVAEQMRRGTHYGSSHELEVEWAERVSHLMPSVEQIKFTSSGTEATLMAMRLSRAFTRRDRVMKFQGHFHGWHDYALIGEHPPFDQAPAGVPQAVVDTMVVAPVNDLDFVDKRLAQNDVAAVILEPSGASYATIPLPDGFLKELRAITERHDTLLIFDEVITGFRWSPGGKQQVVDVRPDLTTMAKILAGGLPGGAVGGRADILQMLEFRDEPGWRKVPHPGTFNANPLSAAAGVACMQMVSDPRVQRQTDEMTARLRAGFNRALVEQDVPGFAWGESSVFHVILGFPCDNQQGSDIHIPEGVAPEQLKSGMSHDLATTLAQGMLNRGVDLFHSGGLLSVAHSEEDIAKTVLAFSDTIAQMKAEGCFA